jgi:hypothetical protein
MSKELIGKPFTDLFGTFETAKKVISGFDNLTFFPVDYNGPNMLDATLIIGKTIGDEYVIQGSGDGVVCIVMKDGSKKIISFSFPSGYPQYLTYYFSEPRKAEVDKINQNRVCRMEFNLDKDNKTNKETIEYLSPTYWSCPVMKSEVAHVTIFSDGIHSFTKKISDDTSTTSVSQNFIPMVIELTNFKSFAGSFAKRRLKGFQKYCETNGLNHNDDLSMATVVM